MSINSRYYEASFQTLREEFRADRKIDKFNLDGCSEEQSNLMGLYCEIYADAKFERDEAEAELDRVRGKWDLDIREDPETFGLDENFKEAAVKHAIELRDDVIEARHYYNEKRREAIIAKGMVDTMEHRKVNIRLLGELWIREYWSKAEVHENVEDQRDQLAKARKRRQRL